LNSPAGVAVDAAGNVYLADTDNHALKELPRAFVSTTPKLVSAAAGSDALPPVLPTSTNLRPPFAPTSDQPWLTITGVTNGVVSFSFTATTTNRLAHITLLGEAIPVLQAVTLDPPTIIEPGFVGDGTFQFQFYNYNPAVSFSVLASTNPALPLSSWSPAATPAQVAPGLMQFTDTAATNEQRFYILRSQ
jgi:hypothetical protein